MSKMQVRYVDRVGIDLLLICLDALWQQNSSSYRIQRMKLDVKEARRTLAPIIF